MTEIDLRSPSTEDELRAFYDPLLTAFAEDFAPGEADAERPLMELDRLINAFDGERRVGSAGAFSMQITVPGGSKVAASGITAVGVTPDMRRRGVLRQMMDWLIADSIKRNEPLSMLWASEAAIYQRFGFGSGTRQAAFEAERGRIAFRDPLPPRDDIRIRLLDLEESIAVIPPIFERATRGWPGTIARSEPYWSNMALPDHEWQRGQNGIKYRAVLEEGGVARGYALYRIKGDWTARGPSGILNVVEVMADDPEIEQRLWQWLSVMDLVSTVKLWRGPLPHPLWQWVLEPRRLGVTIIDGLWLRIVDVPAALAARTYGMAGTLVLEVADTMIDGNAGRWQLTARADGTADVARTTLEPDLTIDVAALASTYLGSIRFSELAAAGRVRASHPGALDTADHLFTASRAPFCNTMF